MKKYIIYLIAVATIMLSIPGCQKEKTDQDEEVEEILEPNEFMYNGQKVSVFGSSLLQVYYSNFKETANVMNLWIPFTDKQGGLILYTILPSGTKNLAQGKYTLSGKTEPYTIISGEISNNSQTLHEVSTAEMSVNYSNEIYTIDFKGTLKNGKLIKGNYTGGYTGLEHR